MRPFVKVGVTFLFTGDKPQCSDPVHCKYTVRKWIMYLHQSQWGHINSIHSFPCRVPAVYQLVFSQGHPQCSFSLPHVLHPKYILSFHTVRPSGTLQSYFPGTFLVSRCGFPHWFPHPVHCKLIYSVPTQFPYNVPRTFHIKYTAGFPRGFFVMSRTGSFTVFPECSRSVPGRSITVSRLGTPRCHCGVPPT